MKKISAFRMEEATARKIKLAATIAGLPAGDFLESLVDDWATAHGLEMVITTKMISRGDAADGLENPR